MKENKKIKNATPLTYNGINFKSKLEVTCYKELVAQGFNPLYEKRVFTLWTGFKPTIPFYNRKKKTKQLELDKAKLRDITYTPDITFMMGDTLIIIELKGQENDVFPVKKKLFRGILEDMGNTMYFEIRSKKELLKAIDIIKTQCNGNTERTA